MLKLLHKKCDSEQATVPIFFVKSKKFQQRLINSIMY